MAWPKISDYDRWSERAFELVLLTVGDDDRVRIAPAGESLYEEYMSEHFGAFSRPPEQVAIAAKFYFYFLTNQTVESSKRKWQRRLEDESEGSVDIGTLRTVFDEELASYRVEGEKYPTIKLVGDMTLAEWRLVLGNYAEKRRKDQKQVERVRKIVHTMEARGAASDTKLRDVGEREVRPGLKTGLKAV